MPDEPRERLTEAEIAGIRYRHSEEFLRSGDTRISMGCNVCRVALPCPTIRALDDLAALQRMIEQLRRENARLLGDVADAYEMVDSIIDGDGNTAAAILGSRGGLRGGVARAKALTPERRSEIAQKAARARWGRVAASTREDSPDD